MRIKELRNGLLVAPIEITYNGNTHIVEDVVIDTGAVRSIIHVPARPASQEFVSRTASCH